MDLYYLANIWLGICILTVADAKVVSKICDIISIDPTMYCYVKEVLTSIAHSPNQLAVDRSNNVLYFSFDFRQGEYIPAMINLTTKKISVLKGVKDAFAMTYDPVGGDMYFGGSHGIYKYSPDKKSLKKLNIYYLDIWWLFFKRSIYFIKFPSLNAYCYENRTMKQIEALTNLSVHQFVLDMEDDLFFINGTGLYGIKNNSDNPVLLRDTPKFLGIAVDNNGIVYVSGEEGIFIVSKMVQKVKRIVKIQGVLSLTFDGANNIIYSDSHQIVRLVPIGFNDTSHWVEPNKV